jgi:hypothetical protein
MVKEERERSIESGTAKIKAERDIQGDGQTIRSRYWQ